MAVFLRLEKSMAAGLGTLTLNLVTQIGQFLQPLSQADQAATETANNMGSAFEDFRNRFSESLGGTQLGGIIESFTGHLGMLQGGALAATGAIAGLAVGAAALAFTSLATMAIETAKADAELAVLANRANVSAEYFYVLAGAAKAFNIEQEQLSDILADTQEKLGEFSATEGGGAADFFDALKNNTEMTEAQIKKFGQTLQGKDGIGAIQAISEKLDELDATKQERRFIFESLASGLGDLAPLFAENSQLLNKYKDALEEAGIVKTAEAIEQSRMLAAQTESLNTRFNGFKEQLAGQMMPVLNSLMSYFMEGVTKGEKFSGVIQAIGVVAKGVAVVIVGLAAAIKAAVSIISGVMNVFGNIGQTVVNFWNAPTLLEKGKALYQGFVNNGNILIDSVTGVLNASKEGIQAADSLLSNQLIKKDKLTDYYYEVGDASRNTADGLRVNTKEAEENAKASEKAANAAKKQAKEQDNLNKMVGASALKDLRLKSGEAIAGGQVRGYTAEFAKMAQEALGSQLTYFSALNDKYHQGKGGRHPLGQAFDFTVKDASKANANISKLQELANKYGFVIKTLNEYTNDSPNKTGGHIHVSVLGYKGNKDILKDAQSEVKMVSDLQAKAEQAKAEIIKQYRTDDEKLERDHLDRLLAISLAFAGDDTAIKKYTDLENAAYQKSLNNLKETQMKKQLEEKKSLLEAQKNWLTAGEYASRYYEIIRQEILNTSEYSPELKNALVRASYSEQGQDENAEREDVWRDYQDMMGLGDNPYERDAKLLAETRQQMLITEEQFQQQRSMLQFKYGAQYGSDFAGMMMGLVDSCSSAYAILYGIQKGFNLASAIMNGYAAISAAWASAPFPYNLPAVAVATMETGVLQAAIQAVAPVGMAHDGIANIPKEGTWLLNKGERVMNPKENQQFTKFMNESQSNQNSQPSQVNVNPNFVIVDERESLSDYLFSPDGTKAFVKFFKRNRSALGV